MRLTAVWTKLRYVWQAPRSPASAVVKPSGIATAGTEGCRNALCEVADHLSLAQRRRKKTADMPSINDIVKLIKAETLLERLDVKSFLAEFEISPETWDEWISRTITASLMMTVEDIEEASPLMYLINAVTLMPSEIRSAITMVTIASMHLGALMERERWGTINLDGANSSG